MICERSRPVKQTCESDLELEHLKKLLRSCLASCEAMNSERMAGRLSMSRDAVLRGLKVLVEAGEVEVIRPISAAGRQSLGQGPEHFRLIRETDDDFLWEQGIVTILPTSRLFDVRELEGRMAFRDMARNDEPARRSLTYKPALSYS